VKAQFWLFAKKVFAKILILILWAHFSFRIEAFFESLRPPERRRGEPIFSLHSQRNRLAGRRASPAARWTLLTPQFYHTLSRKKFAGKSSLYLRRRTA
jgi:hypothetical protein